MAQRRDSSGELALAKSSERDSGADRTDSMADDAPPNAFPDGSASKEMTLPEGQILGIEDGRIIGWAWDRSRPYETVDVELYIGELRVGGGPADRFDLELAKAKRGNGIHRFEVSLDRLPPTAPPFVVRAVIAGTDVELEPSLTLPTLDAAEQLVSSTKYLGQVTGIVDGMLCGWVLNWHNPHEQPILTLRDGETDVLTRLPTGHTAAAINAGLTANAHRFELPLPAKTLLDGKQHVLSVLVGASNQELAGSPIMFGPTDVASIGRSLSAAFEQIQFLEHRVSSLQPGLDGTTLERQVYTSVLDRVDMLLNIHRDGIERQLAVMRRQITDILQHSPHDDPDVILPVGTTPAIEDESKPSPETFTILGRTSPSLSFDLGNRPETITPSGGFTWSQDAGEAALSITGTGSVSLEGIPPGGASLILRGTGAFDLQELGALVLSYHGQVLVGRFEIDESGAWSFAGTTVGNSVPGPSETGLAFAYLPEIASPSGQLRLKQISILPRGRIPEWVSSDLPHSVVVCVGSDTAKDGWHAVETGARGGLCWMGASAEVEFRLKQSGTYNLYIPEVRPLNSDIMSKLQVTLCGTPLILKVAPASADHSEFEVRGVVRIPFEETGRLVLRLGFPPESVRSPMELGTNDDQRQLSIALRMIALNAQSA